MFWATDSQAAHRPLRFTPCPPGIGGRADGGAVIRRDEATAPQADGARILHHVWNYDFGGDSNVVETYISYLRKKIDRVDRELIDAQDPAMIGLTDDIDAVR